MASSLDELDDAMNEEDDAEAEPKEDDELDDNENMIFWKLLAIGEEETFLGWIQFGKRVFLSKCLILSDEQFFVFRSQNGLDDDRIEPIRSIQISPLAEERPYRLEMPSGSERR